jgi:hypothetical protein
MSVSCGPSSLRTVVLVIAATTVLWDGIEIRFEPGTGAVYWRSDWDWDSGGGGITEWVAYITLFVGPAIAAALAYAAVVEAGFRRLTRRRWRALIAAVAAPLGVMLAVGLFFAIALHPLLLYSERYS